MKTLDEFVRACQELLDSAWFASNEVPMSNRLKLDCLQLITIRNRERFQRAIFAARVNCRIEPTFRGRRCFSFIDLHIQLAAELLGGRLGNLERAFADLAGAPPSFESGLNEELAHLMKELGVSPVESMTKVLLPANEGELVFATGDQDTRRLTSLGISKSDIEAVRKRSGGDLTLAGFANSVGIPVDRIIPIWQANPSFRAFSKAAKEEFKVVGTPSTQRRHGLIGMLRLAWDEAGLAPIR